jgi:hypothetical protein
MSIESIFRKHVQNVEDAGSSDVVAASILTLAEVVNNRFDDLDQKLCMGIRYGLFGANASDHDDIRRDISVTLTTDDSTDGLKLDVYVDKGVEE